MFNTFSSFNGYHPGKSGNTTEQMNYKPLEMLQKSGLFTNNTHLKLKYPSAHHTSSQFDSAYFYKCNCIYIQVSIERNGYCVFGVQVHVSVCCVYTLNGWFIWREKFKNHSMRFFTRNQTLKKNRKITMEKLQAWSIYI